MKISFLKFFQHGFRGYSPKRGANQVLNSYIEITEQRLVNEWDCMMDWGGKLAGAALRISALIHATEEAKKRYFSQRFF